MVCGLFLQDLLHVQVKHPHVFWELSGWVLISGNRVAKPVG